MNFVQDSSIRSFYSNLSAGLFLYFTEIINKLFYRCKVNRLKNFAKDAHLKVIKVSVFID